MKPCLTNVLSVCIGVLIWIIAGTASAVLVSPNGPTYRMDYNFSTNSLSGPYIAGDWFILIGTSNPLENGTSFRLDVYDSSDNKIGTTTFTNRFDFDLVGSLQSGTVLSPPTGATDPIGYILLSNIDANFALLDFRWRLRTVDSSTSYESLAISAVPTLFSRLGGQAIYDADLDITWLADARLAITNTFGLPTGIPGNVSGVSNIGPNGEMNWYTADEWINRMNADNYLGVNGWRMAASRQPDLACTIQSESYGSYGFNCTGSEMGHLFYNELIAQANTSIADTGEPAILSKFVNILPAGLYWTGTVLSDNVPFPMPYRFAFYDGEQDACTRNCIAFVWPVIDGDVFFGKSVDDFPWEIYMPAILHKTE